MESNAIKYKAEVAERANEPRVGGPNSYLPKAEYDRRLEVAGNLNQMEVAKEEYRARPSEERSKGRNLPDTLAGQQFLDDFGVAVHPGEADKNPEFEKKAEMYKIAKGIAENPGSRGKDTIAKIIGTDLRKQFMPGSSAQMVSPSISESSARSIVDDEHEPPEVQTPERDSSAPRNTPQKPETMRYASQGDDAREELGERKIISAKNNNPNSDSANASFKVVLDDGSKALFKPVDGEEKGLRGSITPGTYAKREVAFSKVADNLGVADISPVTVMHFHEDADGERHGALQSWIAGTPAADSDQILSKRNSEKMRVADYVTGNTDRHGRNLVITDNGEPGLIDHGLTFPQHNGDRNINVQPMGSIDREINDLEQETHAQIQKIDTVRLATTLLGSGIKGDAIRNTVARALKLQEHPEIIERTRVVNYDQAKVWQSEWQSNKTLDEYGPKADKIINKIIAEEDSEP